MIADLGEEKHFELLQLLCESLIVFNATKKILSSAFVGETCSCYVVCSFFLYCFFINLLMKRRQFVNL
ncbi:hypothetical protein L1887_35550 [Cichorium endivia]|nr:hypothetical protein L1887_35550 [Cichorium endivia]